MPENLSPSVLIAGGYGVVGSDIARLIRAYHPGIRILLGGRHPEKGRALAEELGNAEAVALDLSGKQPLLAEHEAPGAVIAAVHDSSNRLLDYAISNGAGLIEIARAGDELMRAMIFTAQRAPKKPVLFSSNWMAGIPAMLARETTADMDAVTRLDMSILFYGKDRGGPDSATAVDGIDAPFIQRLGKVWQEVLPMTDPRKLRFPSGKKAKAYRVNMPDVLTLPLASGAASATVRLAVDSPINNFLSMFLLRSRIWKLIPRETRRSLVHNPGPGARHEVVIEAEGTGKDGKPAKRRLGLLDPQGQVHLTALGVLLQLERVLGLGGKEPLPAGICFPETAPDFERLHEMLAKEGVEIKRDGF